jgi:hypothetical protein
VVGQHVERYDFPVWEVRYTRNMRSQWADEGEIDTAHVKFVSALPAIHSDDSGSTTAAKAIHASYYEPQFAELADSYDFVPPESSHTVNSTQVYGRTKASTSSSLNQGSFSALLQDGITDNLLSFKNEFLWFKFFADRNESSYIAAQGKLGVSRTFPAGDDIAANCTISPEAAGVEVSA